MQDSDLNQRQVQTAMEQPHAPGWQPAQKPRTVPPLSTLQLGKPQAHHLVGFAFAQFRNGTLKHIRKLRCGPDSSLPWVPSLAWLNLLFLSNRGAGCSPEAESHCDTSPGVSSY